MKDHWNHLQFLTLSLEQYVVVHSLEQGITVCSLLLEQHVTVCSLLLEQHVTVFFTLAIVIHFLEKTCNNLNVLQLLHL